MKTPCKYLQGVFVSVLVIQMADIPKTTRLLLEAAVADLQHAATIGKHKEVSPVREFTDVMLQLAETTGCVACTHLLKENQLYFLIEDDAPYICEFLAPWTFRSVLIAVASLVWDQNPQVPGHEAFNPYGDRKEIEHINSSGITSRFFIETANTNGQPYYFLICKL